MESYLQLVIKYNKLVETWFLVQTSQINFAAFCIIYSIILIFLIRKVTEKRVWRPKNKQLKTLKQKIKQSILTTIFGLPIIRYFIQKKMKKSMDQEEKKVIEQLHKQWDQKKTTCLPTQGMNEDNLRKKIFQWSEKEKKIWMTGKVSGGFYVDEEQHMRKLNDFAATYLYHNPLHLDTYKQLLKIEKQILDMTNSLITSENRTYFGTVTSGGSESLILALYAYRQFYSDRKKPNIVIPVTAHAAIDKGCFYLNIEARKARLNSNFEVDVNHMKSLIDKNTIMILGSAPNYPHGIVDPIEEIAKLAKKKNVGCHIDACLGGFVGVFHKQLKNIYSLDRQGVTSISLDHHKFGLAPKGVSSVFYKTRQLRQSQFYVNADWIGGLYATPTFPGSRSGFPSAAAWYSLTQTTMEGFKQNAKQIVQSTIIGVKRLSQVKGIQVFGNPKVCALAFRTTEQQCSHLSLVDYLIYEKKWKISSVHKPYGIHLSVTLANCKNVRQTLWRDVDEGLKNLREKKQPKKSMSSTLYGTTTKIPTNGMQLQVLKLLVATSTK